jgi:hypothetical protein
MGWSDLGYASVNDTMRLVMGVLVVDSLEYSEQWRDSATVRACLTQKWPGYLCFEPAQQGEDTSKPSSC